MSEQIIVETVDTVFIKLRTSQGLAYELSEYFSFMSPTAKHDKRVKQKLWDGKIRLFNLKTRQLHAGLFEKVIEFAKQYGYEVIDNRKGLPSERVTDEKLQKFFEYLELPEDRQPRDYQIEGLRYCIDNHRAMLLSPTSSGKSLLIYMICRWFNRRTLIIVPTTTLVKQMAEDFYSYNYKGTVSEILAGASKENLNKITVSTWQSIYTMPAEWLQQFDVIIGDEAHGFKANSLKSIMENSTARVRIGTTGTLDGLKVNELSIQGLFGPIRKLITTRELIDRGQVADLKLLAYDLEYPEDERKAARRAKTDGEFEYDDEQNYIYEHKRRSLFLYGLIKRLSGNKLILFKKVSHGKAIYEHLKEIYPNVHIVYGDIDTNVRNDIRALTEKSNDAIIVASFKTFGTGISIINLQHVILAASIKSQITLIQAIGRSLRKGGLKVVAYVHDLGDNISIGRYTNYSYTHFQGRMELYTKERLPFKYLRIRL